MAHRNFKDNSSLVPRLSMSALRERTHLQKRLDKFDREEEKELRKIKQRQDCLMQDLKGSGGEIQQRDKDLLSKQKQLMELRRARFSAPAMGTVKRQNPEQAARSSSVEVGDEAKFEEIFALSPRRSPNLTLKAAKPKSPVLSPFRFPSPEEFLKKAPGERGVFINKAGPKQEITYLKPPPLDLKPHELRSARGNSELVRKSSSEAETAEVEIKIVDIEQAAEERTEEEAMIRRGTPEFDNVTQSAENYSEGGRDKDAAQTQRAGVGSATNKRRRKIGIQHCVNEIAPVFNRSLLSNGESPPKCDDGSGKKASSDAMLSIDEEKAPACVARENNDRSTADKAMQMRRDSPVSPISTSNGRKTSFSSTERKLSTSHLGMTCAADFRLRGDVYTEKITPHSARRKSLNQRRFSRISDNGLVRGTSSHLDHNISGDNTQGSHAQTAALENFKRLAYLSVASSQSFGEKKTKLAPLERKLSRARLEEIQKPTESSSRQLITKHRSVSVSGAHPNLHELAPELRQSAPSGLRTFRKLSVSAKQRRWSSATNPLSPLPLPGEKTLSEMMADVKDCRYLRNGGPSSSTESEP